MRTITYVLLGLLLVPTLAAAQTQQQLLNSRPAIIAYIRGQRPAFNAAMLAQSNQSSSAQTSSTTSESSSSSDASSSQQSSVNTGTFNPTAEQQQLLDAFNDERAKVGAGPIVFHENLDEAAQRHGNDMNDNNFFSHTGSDDSSASIRIGDTGYYSICACAYKTGEILVKGATSVAEAVQAWLNSPTHRDIMLDPDFQHVGLVHIGAYWVGVFGMLQE